MTTISFFFPGNLDVVSILRSEDHTEHLPWCDDMKERLISEFRTRECLWNPSDVSYRNLRVKKQAIAEVAAKLSSAFGSTVSGKIFGYLVNNG